MLIFINVYAGACEYLQARHGHYRVKTYFNKHDNSLYIALNVVNVYALA